MRPSRSRLNWAGWTLVVIGVAVAANSALMFDPDGAYQRAVADITAAAVPAFADPSAFARAQSQFAALGGGLFGLLLALAHLIAAALLLRGARWAPIVGIVVALVGIFQGALMLATIAIGPDWLVPLPMFAGMDRATAVPLTIVGSAVAGVAYAYVTLMCARALGASGESQ